MRPSTAFTVIAVVGLLAFTACSPSHSANATTTAPTASRTSSAQPSTSNPISLAAIQRLDGRVGFIAAWTGGGPGLARTTDGGTTWKTIATPTARITGLRFIDQNVGWAAGMIPRPMAGVACQQAPPTPMDPCYGVVLRTQDGGLTWQKALLVVDDGVYSDPILQIQAIDGQLAWALVLACTPTSQPVGTYGCPAEVRRTSDGGHTWTTQTSGYIDAIRFATPHRGWLTSVNPDGSFDIKVTDDGGMTWLNRLHTTSGEVVGLDAANAQTAWVMTRNGGYCTATTCTNYELFRTTDGGSTWSSLGNPKPSTGACGSGQLVGPLFASATEGWLAENTGAGGVKVTTGVLHSEDGGRSWRCLSSLSNTYLVSAADPLHLWVTSNNVDSGATTIYSSDDGGASWRALTLMTRRD